MRIGINGLGRIGRGLMRIIWGRPDLRIVALNDVAPAETLGHLLAHDTTYGPWQADIQGNGGAIRIDGEAIPFSRCAAPTEVPWEDHGVDRVVEATGRFKDRLGMESHGRPVLLTAASVHADRQVVFGVNHDTLVPSDRLVSAASCTTHCVSPVLAALRDVFTVNRVFFNTVHCYNVGQPLVDAPAADPRRARAAGVNIIPTTTSASRALGAVFPDMEGRIEGMAVRVPAPAVSLTDMMFEVDGSPSLEEVLRCVEAAAEGPLRGILGLEPRPLVSQDYVGDSRSSVVDVSLTRVSGNLVRLVAWYDNERGYTARLADLLGYMERSFRPDRGRS